MTKRLCRCTCTVCGAVEFVGIEREAAYADISRNRLEAAEAEFYGVADLV